MVSGKIKIVHKTYKFETELALALDVADKTVTQLREDYFSNQVVISSIKKDVKTEADISAHNYIYKSLLCTGIPILSEEEKQIEDFDINVSQWIIDPIDGTYNFTRKFPYSAVSIALWVDGNPVIGVIKNIFDQSLFYSCVNQGAFRNKEKIYVSKVENVSEAVLATGFPSGSSYKPANLEKTLNNIKSFKKIRMIGSAALMLCYVGCGIFDAYSEEDIYIWDVAAGLAVVQQAGGLYNLLPGRNSYKFKVKASNNDLISKF